MSDLIRGMSKLFDEKTLIGMNTQKLMDQLRLLPNVESVKVVEGSIWVVTIPMKMPDQMVYSTTYSIGIDGGSDESM